MSPFFNDFSAPRSTLHHFGGYSYPPPLQVRTELELPIPRMWDCKAHKKIPASAGIITSTFPLNPPLKKGNLVKLSLDNHSTTTPKSSNISFGSGKKLHFTRGFQGAQENPLRSLQNVNEEGIYRSATRKSPAKCNF